MESLMVKLKTELDGLLASFNENYVKFTEKGNKASGKRMRVEIGKIKKTLSEIRSESLNN